MKVLNDYLPRILTARVYDLAVETPLDYASNLSARVNNKIWLKREDLQPVFSFKIRGAYNKLSQLSAEQLQRGVITASAGNHAQGVAISAKHLGCKAMIVMPATTPQIKVDAVAGYGAEVVLQGDSFNEAYLHAMQLVEQTGAVYISPFDDPDVIAGQGTIGVELLRQHPDPLDAVFVPIGGGGLAAGVACYIKQLKPQVKIIGVQTTDSDGMYQSIKKGEIVELKEVGLFSDGTAVKRVGDETFRLCQKYLDDVICVNTDEICAAIKDIFTDTRSIAEPAGALAVAGAKAYIRSHNWQEKVCAAVISGANMNFDRLRHVSERSELGEQREAIIAVTIPEKAGSFRHFCRILEQRNITEFNYRYSDSKHAHIFVGIAIQDRSEVDNIIHLLAEQGLKALDLTDNEIAKLHLRHMVGGHATHIENERLMRFEFPEKPGALSNFLESMQTHWNISLFHYRNHGADCGRVLAGIQVEPEEVANFEAFLAGLNYPYLDETENPAYKLFLA